MIEIKEIDVEKTYPIRHKVLRQNKGFETCKFISDSYEGTFHMGLYYNEELVSIVSFCPEINEEFESQKQFRLRGMATLKECRGKGFGRMLIMHSEQMLFSNETELIWCNVRIKAIGFYEKLGYKTYGKPFEFKDIGKHILMFKKD